MSWIRESKGVICGLTVSASVLGVAAYWSWRRHRNKYVLFPTSPSEIHIVSTESQWDAIYPQIHQEILTCKVLGFDCEWVPLAHSSRPVSVLQLATPSGVCILIQLLLLGDVPDTLQDLLADKSILKVGVGCKGDAGKLFKDHALLVRGCVDLRSIVNRHRIKTSGMSLKALTAAVLGVQLNKDLLVRAGNWELNPLTDKQIQYAAMDALVGVKVFLVLMNAKLGRPLAEQNQPITEEENWGRVQSMCQGIVDSERHVRNYAAKKSTNKASVKASGSLGEASGSQGGAAMSRTNTYKHNHRKRPLYHNCQLRAPDGQLLCTCDQQKALWYISKGLGEKVCEDPLTIQLTFEPSGRPVSDKNYYLQEKTNQCVVCGAVESYIRKNIIPHDYRKHFPPMLKEHRSHDIVLMCSPCHQLSNQYDAVIVEQLAVRCNVFTHSDEGRMYTVDRPLQRVKSAAKALLNTKANIPAGRREELAGVVTAYYGVSTITPQLLQQALLIDSKLPNSEYVPSGERVVHCVVEDEGLVVFERMWRQHFLDVMKPKYLPQLWSVDHSHQDLAHISDDIKNSLSVDKS